MFQRFSVLFFLVALFQSVISLQVNSSELYLSDKFKITAEPTVRNYDWAVRNETGAPDGFTRQMLVINSQFPGPLIELNEGDTLNIRVKNYLSAGLTIHWHGIFQNGSAWMDGVTGVTQCPIPPGSEFTYTFTVRDQYGTAWYHAHAQNLNADGIAGPLIVHSVRDPLKRGVDYNQDIVLVINDWYHNLSQVIVQGMLSPDGYNNSLAAPSANSALINGIGYFDCSFAQPGSNCIKPSSQTLDLALPAGTKTRLRLIQAGSHALFRFSADNHPLNVTEADTTGVIGPSAIHRVPFHNGQRYSVILDTTNDTVGSSFYLRAVMDLDCFAWLAPGIDGIAQAARAIVRIVDPNNFGSLNTSSVPSTRDWTDTLGGPCTDLDPSTLVPIISQDACTNVLGRAFYANSFGFITNVSPNGNSTTVSGRFFVNDTTWLTYPFRPLLSDMLSGGSGVINQSEVAAFTFDTSGCYDIVINNLDAALDHSYHLHGVDGWIVATGTGELSASVANTIRYNTTNPLRRDTQVVAGGSYHVVRVLANNPGIWILHCHLGWHLAAGFAGMIVMQPSVLRTQTLPPGNQDLCKGISAEEAGVIEPGRRKRGLVHQTQSYQDLKKLRP
ncbi:multi-copper oxidase laccase-like protein [Phakopsora pachyrhizi]|uniref:Multi-copper oxidase laccase-like protein n=1 Tax=Phakopsora pachyrhizi TaxID=170000 RepID=A0AAV0B5X9_PHAPC|nr:multi-copper oxidase laccase-like protein [Phakopsora pachyrhizi]CAH7681440.1 multi-copper oxidase laccase-like protein [Phakopsora pachyrhizi]